MGGPARGRRPASARESADDAADEREVRSESRLRTRCLMNMQIASPTRRRCPQQRERERERSDAPAAAAVAAVTVTRCGGNGRRMSLALTATPAIFLTPTSRECSELSRREHAATSLTWGASAPCLSAQGVTGRASGLRRFDRWRFQSQKYLQPRVIDSDLSRAATNPRQPPRSSDASRATSSWSTARALRSTSQLV